ncbi:uncharacterized protein LOC122625576 [Drosophila teissieri]|uniref:uncharacterized protein LOC122625576 n=1 Tax=Drosophila teissieri TaxID=7243 RepID=UPI001CBA569A|nr:uncharacterized protein LOC122625576 [Drosophila teissieri]
MGMFKTARRIRNKYFWPQLTKDVRKFVRSCESCQQYKVEQQKAAGKMLTRVAEAPWETVCVDFVGPLPRSKHGNTTLLVMVDKFSKWVELAAIRQATADSFLRVFRERIVTRYGAPKILISDNGVQFTGRKTKKEMESEDQTNWDDKIPELMLAFNSSTSESTKYSPAQIVLGKKLRIPNTVFDKKTEGSGLKEESMEESPEKDGATEIGTSSATDEARRGDSQADGYRPGRPKRRRRSLRTQGTTSPEGANHPAKAPTQTEIVQPGLSGVTNHPTGTTGGADPREMSQEGRAQAMTGNVRMGRTRVAHLPRAGGEHPRRSREPGERRALNQQAQTRTPTTGMSRVAAGTPPTRRAEKTRAVESASPDRDILELHTETTNELGWTVPTGAGLSEEILAKIRANLANKPKRTQRRWIQKDGERYWRITSIRGNYVTVKRHFPKEGGV